MTNPAAPQRIQRKLLLKNEDRTNPKVGVGLPSLGYAAVSKQDCMRSSIFSPLPGVVYGGGCTATFRAVSVLDAWELAMFAYSSSKLQGGVYASD